MYDNLQKNDILRCKKYISRDGYCINIIVIVKFIYVIICNDENYFQEDFMKKIKVKGIMVVLVAIITVTINSVFFALDLKNAITVMPLSSIIGGMIELYLGYLITKDAIKIYN